MDYCLVCHISGNISHTIAIIAVCINRRMLWTHKISTYHPIQRAKQIMGTFILGGFALDLVRFYAPGCTAI